jgi:anthranilate synthase/aminodeoxychorismate synthase-like glutamine amidotransferase
VIRAVAGEIPLLGVCLGHQAIAEALGGRVVRAAEPVHGRTSRIRHQGRGIFAGLADPIIACRYHSLIVDEATLPEELEVIARTEDGLVMALQHRRFPLAGVQFHPESILTDAGYPLLAAFLRLASLPVPYPLPTLQSEQKE